MTEDTRNPDKGDHSRADDGDLKDERTRIVPSREEKTRLQDLPVAPSGLEGNGSSQPTVLVDSPAAPTVTSDRAERIADASEPLTQGVPSDQLAGTGDKTVMVDDVPRLDDRTERISAPGSFNDRTEAIGEHGGGFDKTEAIGTDQATRRTDAAAAAPRASRSTTGGGGGEISLTVGSVLRQRFRITGVLGEGGMGAVYSAVDMLKEEARDENVNVALKVMKPDIVDAELSFMGLQREARRAQQLAHPNIVTVYDFDRADGVIYMTMEFMRGKPLDAVLEEKPHGLDLEQARDITTQICKGLAYAHKEGIVHSDLKPQNVFVLENGRAKILDFGIARAYQAKKVDMVETVFAGYSPAFASPEVIARKSPSPADDVFALGLVVYQLFTGRHPFDWVSADQALKQGIKPKRDKSFKRSEWAVVQAALSFDGSKRPQDAAEFLKRFAPSRVRQIAVGVCLATLLAAGTYVYLYDPVVGPDVPFEELSPRVQTEITRNLADAQAFLGFGDIDSAFQLYDAVLTVHPGNLDATAGIEEAARHAARVVVDAVRSGRTTPEAGRQTLQSLMAYETLPSRGRRELSRALDSL